MTSQHSKASIVICSLCAPQNRAGLGCGKQPRMLCLWRGCWRNTEKWPRFAAVTVLTSEFPPPSFKKSVLIWKMDAVVNCIQNCQAYAKLFFSRCQSEAKKYLQLLCSDQPKARKTLAKMARVKELLSVELPKVFPDKGYKYSLVAIFSAIGNFSASQGDFQNAVWVIFLVPVPFRKMCDIFSLTFYIDFSFIPRKLYFLWIVILKKKLEQLTWQ